MTTYALIHEHEYNMTVYTFEYVGREDRFPCIRTAAKALGVNFEPEKGERLSMEILIKATVQIAESQADMSGLGPDDEF